MTGLLPFGGVLLALALVAAMVVLVLRAIARASPTLARLVVLGLLLRLVAGGVVFSISYFDLPVLAALHTGDGFWRLAPDARSYYRTALHALTYGFDSVPPMAVSPMYVKVLALWLRVVWAHPSAGFLFNLVCYVLLCGVVVGLFQGLPHAWRERARLLAIGAITGSPALLVFGTQSLKDTFFALLAVSLCVGAYYVASSLDDRAPTWWRRLGIGWAVLIPVSYVAAGVRPYFVFIAWSCLGLLFLASGLRHGLARLGRVVSVAAATLAAVWVVFVAGAGARAAPFETLMGFDRIGLRASWLLFAARSSYIQSGGGTSITGAEVLDHEDHAGLVAMLRSWGPAEHARALTLGLAMLFVPVQVLQAWSVVDFEGGRNMLLLTDVDTVFFDLTIAAGLVLLVRARAALRPNTPYAWFAFALTALLTVLMAYVVTNYGTLVRLRIMIGLLVWTLPLALRAGGAAPDGRLVAETPAPCDEPSPAASEVRR